MNYDELYHYGVKGMRWGFRKDENGEYLVTKKAKALKNKVKNKINNYNNNRNRRKNAEAIISGDRNKVRSRFTKLSNDQLQVAIERINYRDILMQPAPSKNNKSVENGDKITTRLKKSFETKMINASTETAANLIASYMSGAVNGSVSGIGAKNGVVVTARNSFKKKK